jgi:hypothetical protein
MAAALDSHQSLIMSQRTQSDLGQTGNPLRGTGMDEQCATIEPKPDAQRIILEVATPGAIVLLPKDRSGSHRQH